MAEYRVSFFNNLISPNGLPLKCMQRSLKVKAHNAEEASKKGKRAFERLEEVPDWKCHAHFIEVRQLAQLTATY